MPRLIWSPRAVGDLKRLYAFLASKNPPAARRAMSIVRQSARRLRDFPQSGRVANDFPEGFRELSIEFGSSGYMLLYRTQEEDVVVLSVRHAREAGY